MKKTVLLLVLALQLISSVLIAQSSRQPFLPLRTDTPPKIDGILDDKVWQEAPSETGFKTWYPDFGVDMTDQTVVWYAYDSENLYFAYRCYDDQPDMIKSSVTSRDKIRSDDWVCLNLDTFNDQQSIYAFYVNPVGIQMDSRASSTNEDLNFDAVWYSDGRIDEEGYTIEIQIPFKSIRYSHDDQVEMGIIFERKISRKSLMGTYPPLDPKEGANFLTGTRPLIYKDINKYYLLEILPAVTYGKNYTDKSGEFTSDGDQKELSLTAKYGLTSRLILDGTINPDFSQVESDAGQVDFNQRFALFYPEKRPFFLEGKEDFNFGGSSGGDPLGAVVHTRMINNPRAGIKLTGKLGPKSTIASIYARDELSDYQNEGDYANFGILRYKRSLNQDSFLGGFYTGREVDNGFSRLYGADGQLRVSGSTLIGFHGFYSDNKTAESSESNDGHAVGANYFYNTRDWMVNIRLHDLSENFNTETGYITRTDVTRFRAGFLKKYYPGSNFIRRIDPLFNTQHIHDKTSDKWEHDNYLGATFILPRSSSIRFGYAKGDEIFLTQSFDTSKLSVSGSSQLRKWFYFSLSYSYGKKIRYVADPYQGSGSNASATMIYQPNDNLNSTLSVSYSDFTRDDNDKKEFDYTIIRSRNTYQLNKYLFFRGIVEYNSFRKEMLTDFLASFTYIPGTVIHLGYGSLYEKTKWHNDRYIRDDNFHEMKRGLFFKASYLWRL